MMNTALHIALVSETFAPEINGVAHTLERLCAGLVQLGHRIQLVRPRQPGEQGRPNEDDLLLTRGWPVPGYPGLQWGQSSRHTLLRRWQRQRPDALYIATEGPLGFSALQAARQLGIPVVSGFHTNFQQYSQAYGFGLLTRVLTHYLRWFHNRTQLTLVPSPSQRLELQRRGFQRVELLTRGVDGQLFSPLKRSIALRDSWGLDEDDIAVLYVGRLAVEKNLELLARSFHTLCARYPARRIKLMVVGDGPQRARLEALLPQALFCGVQRADALATHYASADLFLFPSQTETFGNVVLEALASGLGVVAFDLAAAAQHIRHGHNGAVAMPGDDEAFIEAACWILEEGETLRRVRLNARQHAGRLGWQATIEQFESCLRSVCTLRKPVAATPTGVTSGSSMPHG